MSRTTRALLKTAQKVKKSEVGKGNKSGGRPGYGEEIIAPDGHIEAKITSVGPVLRVRLNNKWYVLELEEETSYTRTKLLARKPPPILS